MPPDFHHGPASLFSSCDSLKVFLYFTIHRATAWTTRLPLFLTTQSPHSRYKPSNSSKLHAENPADRGVVDKMLKIWSMKQEKQKSEAAAGPTKKKKVTAAQLRTQKGMEQLHDHGFVIKSPRDSPGSTI